MNSTGINKEIEAGVIEDTSTDKGFKSKLRKVASRMHLRRFLYHIVHLRDDYVRVFVDKGYESEFSDALKDFTWTVPLIYYGYKSAIPRVDVLEECLQTSKTIVFFVDKKITRIREIEELSNGNILKKLSNDIFSLYEIEDHLVIQSIRSHTGLEYNDLSNSADDSKLIKPLESHLGCEQKK